MSSGEQVNAKTSNAWRPATIIGEANQPRSYIIQNNEGRIEGAASHRPNWIQPPSTSSESSGQREPGEFPRLNLSPEELAPSTSTPIGNYNEGGTAYTTRSGRVTSYCNALKEHKRNKHTDPSLKCKVCKYVAFGEVDLKNHTCKESLCCGECGYKTHTRPNFIRHKEVHNTLPYSCSLCRTRSKSKTYFTAHMKNKHQVLNIDIEEYITPVTTYLNK
ncbi:ZNF462 [Cordylochernes scorpioides]|uniref:ZNF462 n=1 Tax=Cordylochernes scorpioides TaxID=51811 RepID=A0ABY6KBI2_9ARAC|nr:ZNF462 [Cordylochernes scorpioides]